MEDQIPRSLGQTTLTKIRVDRIDFMVKLREAGLKKEEIINKFLTFGVTKRTANEYYDVAILKIREKMKLV